MDEIVRLKISIALMIAFLSLFMFFMGYKVAYNRAVEYANEQIKTNTNDYQATRCLVSPLVLDDGVFEDGG